MDLHPNMIWTAAPATVGSAELSIMARSMLAARRALHGPLPSEFIHDTALDLLLHLFVASEVDQAIPIAELIQLTTVSKTVALRWINALVQSKLIETSEHLAILTPAGTDKVEAGLRAVAASQWRLVD